LPHALRVAQFVEEFHIRRAEAGRLLYVTAWYLKERGRYPEAGSLYQRALYIQEQTLGPVHLDVARSLNGLALLYSEQSRYAEAEPLLQRARSIWEQQLGAEHVQVAYPLNNLANLCWKQGRYAEAEPLYQRAALPQQNLPLSDFFTFCSFPHRDAAARIQAG